VEADICGVPYDFVELAFPLLSASSASTERVLSSFGGIHTKIYGVTLVTRKWPSWYFLPGSSKDFVIWIFDD